MTTALLTVNMSRFDLQDTSRKITDDK